MADALRRNVGMTIKELKGLTEQRLELDVSNRMKCRESQESQESQESSFRRRNMKTPHSPKSFSTVKEIKELTKLRLEQQADFPPTYGDFLNRPLTTPEPAADHSPSIMPRSYNTSFDFPGLRIRSTEESADISYPEVNTSNSFKPDQFFSWNYSTVYTTSQSVTDVDSYVLESSTALHHLDTFYSGTSPINHLSEKTMFQNLTSMLNFLELDSLSELGVP